MKKVNAANATTSTATQLKPFTAPDFSAISKFVLDSSLAAYVLTIELQVMGLALDILIVYDILTIPHK